MPPARVRSALGIAGPYLALSVLWIVVTDRLALEMAPGHGYEIGLAKGLVFVALSSALIFFLALRADRRERASRASYEQARWQLERAQQVARLGSWEVDLGRETLTWSDQVFAIFGIQRERFAGTEEAFFELVHPDDRPWLWKARAALLAGESDLDAQHRIVRPDGEVRWVHERARLIRDAEGRPAFTTGTVQDITERKVYEERLREQSQRLTALSRQLLEAQESERRAIAGELHDQVGQSLTLASMALQQAARDESPGRLIAEAQGHVADILHNVRQLSLDLRPSMLDDLGLLPTLSWLVDRHGKASPASLQLRAEVSEHQIPARLRVPAFRIVQEALTNAMRHAEASAIRLSLDADDAWLTVRVEDDGRGFEVADRTRRSESGESLGLIGMRERAELVGGDLRVESRAGHGTRIEARLPLRTGNGPA